MSSNMFKGNQEAEAVLQGMVKNRRKSLSIRPFYQHISDEMSHPRSWSTRERMYTQQFFPQPIVRDRDHLLRKRDQIASHRPD
jgi:hypothetical protein